jgi:hypothetical protein
MLSMRSSRALALFFLGALLLCAWACGDDDAAPPPTVAASSTAAASGGAAGMGSGGMAGAGAGTLGTCPDDEPATNDVCDSVDLVCAYATTCCICENLQCALHWACVDPADNAAACPGGAPVADQPCPNDGLTCSYCIGGVPEGWACVDGSWAEAEIASCT